MPSVFISYNHHIKSQVLPVAEHLESLGYRVFRDESMLVNNDDIANEVIEKIRSSQYFLLCYSKHVKGSDWVMWETGLASMLKDKGKIRMVIYKFDEADLPSFLDGRLMCDLTLLAENGKSLETQLAIDFPKTRGLRRRFDARIRMAISVGFCLAFLFVGINHVRVSQDYTDVSMVHSGSRGWRGDPSNENDDLILGVADIRSSDSVIVIEVICQNQKQLAKLFLKENTRLHLKGAKSLKLDMIITDQYEEVPIGSNSLLLAKDLPLESELKLLLVFSGNEALDDDGIAELEWSYKTSTYGLGRTLRIDFDTYSR